MTFTVGCIGAAFAGPVIAKILGKEINMRVVYSIGVFLAMLGFFGTGMNAFIPDSQRSEAGTAAIL